MEKSIEKIWKKGFLNPDAVSIPKIESVESLQSIYLVDQFKRMYKTNIIALMITAVLILFAFIVGGVPFIGMMMFSLFAGLAVLGNQKLNKLDGLNKTVNSYDYIRSFDAWLKDLLSSFLLVYKFWIPLFFIGFSLGVLQTKFFVPFIGETLLERFAGDASLMIAGVPVVWLFVILFIAALLSYFSNRIFKMEMKSIYGDTLYRLEQLLAEMEALR